MIRTKTVYFIHVLVAVFVGQIKGQYSYYVPNGVDSRFYTEEYNTTKIAVNAGKVKDLKGLSKVNIVYSYEGMGVNTFRKEEEYLREIKHLNKEDSALANIFIKNWLAFRKQKYEPEFERAFNEAGKEYGIVGTNYSAEADITLKVETVQADIKHSSGKDNVSGDSRKIRKTSSSINVQFTFVNKNGLEIVRYYLKNCSKIERLDFTSPDAMGLSKNYERAARILVKELVKKLKPKKLKI